MLSRMKPLKLSPEVVEQLKELESTKMGIDGIARKLGFKQLGYDEMYFIDKAFSLLAGAKGDNLQTTSSYIIG